MPRRCCCSPGLVRPARRGGTPVRRSPPLASWQSLWITAATATAAGRPETTPTGLEVFLDDTAVLCRFFHRPVVVGASLGGMAALMGIGRSEIDARALVLVDVAPRLEFGGAARILEFMSAHPTGFATLDEAADWIAAYLPQRDRPASTAGLEKVLRPHGDRWRWHWDPRFLAGATSQQEPCSPASRSPAPIPR